MTGFAISNSVSPTNVTLSDENLCHYITDDQLRRLGEMRKDLVIEVCLAAVGIFFGSLVPAVSGLVRFNNDNGATGVDLLSIVLCAAAFFVALVTGYQWHVRRKGHVDLETEIRNRPKLPVTHVPA